MTFAAECGIRVSAVFFGHNFLSPFKLEWKKMPFLRGSVAIFPELISLLSGLINCLFRLHEQKNWYQYHDCALICILQTIYALILTKRNSILLKQSTGIRYTSSTVLYTVLPTNWYQINESFIGFCSIDGVWNSFNTASLIIFRNLFGNECTKSKLWMNLAATR